MMRIILSSLIICVICGLLLAIHSNSCASREQTIILLTTTSVQDTGFLDKIIPLFQKKHPGYRVKTIALGSGEAMAMARKGEGDVLLTHSPQLEEEFIKEGFGISRKPLMYNYFIILGPSDDPAGVKSDSSAVEAFRRIYQTKSRFVSRGDNSGTHNCEMEIWKRCGIKPVYPGYLESGQGMSATIRIASEKQCYTLVDSGTYSAMRKHLVLTVCSDFNKELRNPYSIIKLNPEKIKGVNVQGARLLKEFLLSEDVREIVRTLGVKEFGEPLFLLWK
ncbi:MAG: substrate-binding domain-containing protein [Planctomycetota bacterium]|nr:substrate-binding domain-containing protein [Planctomycetota bacterium]MDI6786820.1 substrate-binding domain-containing protein [Planctomycetota bacterium]